MLTLFLSAFIAVHQPTIRLGHSAVAVDTGGSTIVSKRARFLAPNQVLRVLGRSDHVLSAPDGYLRHWYLTTAIVASVGPTWIAKGPVVFDFANDRVSLASDSSKSASIPIRESQEAPFIDVGIEGRTYTCLFDTGAVGQTPTGLDAVNALEARTFDSLVRLHPTWLIPGTVTIAADKGTSAVPWLRVPDVTVGHTRFRGVRFVRREPRTFAYLTKLLGRDVRCDAGGALFTGRVVTLDLAKKSLQIK